MYLFSVVIVWGAIFIFEDKMIPDGVFNEIASDPGRVALVFFMWSCLCGWNADPAICCKQSRINLI